MHQQEEYSMSQGGYIYAIDAVGTGLVKIGCTRGDVQTRLAALQTGQPNALQLVASALVETDPGSIERAIHRGLEASHQRGEWFAIAMDQGALEALIAQAKRQLHEAIPRTLGKKVYRLRVERKLTQQELAERAGVSQAIISRLETDDRTNVTSDVLKGLAKVLGCTTDYLVGMHEDEDKDEAA
jgi:DNA-binding Xre family transcriptional regulator